MDEWVGIACVLMLTAFLGGLVMRPYFERWWWGPWESYENMDGFIASLEEKGDGDGNS